MIQYDHPPQSVKETLERVRELLSDRKRWTKGTYARTGNNRDVDVFDPKAAKFCILGAIRRVNGTYTQEAADAFDSLTDDDPAGFNDKRGTTHTDLLAVIDKAIAAADQ